MKRALVAACALAAVTALAPRAHAQFSYDPPGQLTPGSGDGRVDFNVYAPGMRFPIEDGPAFANSQVWGHGGNSGPGGGQCDSENFSYPWQDNYCETRDWDMPLCPSGVGHQGQDIRAATCDSDTYWAVAAVDGTITNVGSYSVYLTADDGTRYDYLHMRGVVVGVGDTVTRGQHMGMVGDNMGSSATTVHLHFNLRQSVSGVGTVYVPPYMSLVGAYEELMNVGTGGVGGVGGAGGAGAVGGAAGVGASGGTTGGFGGTTGGSAGVGGSGGTSGGFGGTTGGSAGFGGTTGGSAGFGGSGGTTGGFGGSGNASGFGGAGALGGAGQAGTGPGPACVAPECTGCGDCWATCMCDTNAPDLCAQLCAGAATGGSAGAAGSASSPTAPAASDPAGCACRAPGATSAAHVTWSSGPWSAVAAATALVFGVRRRRAARKVEA